MMAKKKWLWLSVLLLVNNAAVVAESDFDFEELMKDVETRIQNIQTNLSAGDVATASSDTRFLQDAFVLVEGYFTKRGNSEDAVVDAKDYQNKTATILSALNAGNTAAAADAAADFSRQCRGACHDKYKPL